MPIVLELAADLLVLVLLISTKHAMPAVHAYTMMFNGIQPD
jgi:hypothetical protein